MGRLTQAPPSIAPWPRPAFATSAQGPTRRARTEKPSASSRPLFASGPTLVLISPPPSGRAPCRLGCAPTTAADPTPPWADNHPAHACPRTTSLVTTASGVGYALREAKPAFAVKPPPLAPPSRAAETSGSVTTTRDGLSCLPARFSSPLHE